MKLTRALPLLLTAGLAAAAYTLDWSTLDGGGGLSAGGAYTVAGTVAQPDAGIHTGGVYQVTGGFWSVPELLQVPGGPKLEFQTLGGIWYVAWPAPSPGWRLEVSTNLNSWTNVPGTPVVSGNFNYMPANPAPAAARRFYRLAFP